MSEKKLFVHLSGLDYNLSEDDRINLIQKLFSPVCELEASQIKLVADRENGGFKNFCFVEFKSDQKDLVKNAIENLNGTRTEEGCNVSISIAKPKERRDYNNGENKSRNGGGYNNRNNNYNSRY